MTNTLSVSYKRPGTGKRAYVLAQRSLNKQILKVSRVSDGAVKKNPLLCFLQSQSLIFFFLPFLVVSFCDWELLGVALRATNEELAGKNTERTSSGRRERGDEIRYLSVNFSQTAFIPSSSVSTSKLHQHMPDRHRLQNSNLKERDCELVCLFTHNVWFCVCLR